MRKKGRQTRRGEERRDEDKGDKVGDRGKEKKDGKEENGE